MILKHFTYFLFIINSDAFHHNHNIRFGSTFTNPTSVQRPSLVTTPSTTKNRHHGLSMMFDQLSSAISEVAKNIGGRNRITESNIKPALRNVRRALLDADVNINVADSLIEGVKKRSIGVEVLKGVTSEQQFIKAMYDELLDVMGGGENTLQKGSDEEPVVILLAGLQGAGKTTAAAKLALFLKEREVDYTQVSEEDAKKTLASRLPTTSRKVLLVAADVYRPAAIQQLEVLGENVGIEVFSKGTDIDPVDIAQLAIDYAKENGFDTVIVDTAGRQVIDDNLMDELKRIKKQVQPAETLLVIDAMTGQEAASLTASFDSSLAPSGLTGALLTKLDGDSRGGAALSVKAVSGKPIKFVGTGEKITDLEPFYADRMASRILGMGDVLSLVEKASREVSDEDAMKMQEKMLKAEFDFNDFLKQSKLVSKMGSIAGVAKMMPGVGNMIDNSQIRGVEQRLKRSEAMICSMTNKERSNPELLITDKTARSRMVRITKGSGVEFQDGLNFISEFQKMRTMMSRMQKQMGGAGGEEEAEMEAAAAAGPGMAVGNRAMRRMQKKKKKGGRGGGKGFG